MSKYLELCQAWEAQDKAELDYWQELQLKAWQIAIGLRNYLEYPEVDYPDLDGKKKIPYVYITKRGDKSEVAHFTELNGSNGAIDFDIILTLEHGPEVFPKSLYHLAMHIGITSGLLRVWSDAPEVKADLVPGELSSYDVLYQRVFELLRSQLAKRVSLQQPA